MFFCVSLLYIHRRACHLLEHHTSETPSPTAPGWRTALAAPVTPVAVVPQVSDVEHWKPVCCKKAKQMREVDSLVQHKKSAAVFLLFYLHYLPSTAIQDLNRSILNVNPISFQSHSLIDILYVTDSMHPSGPGKPERGKGTDVRIKLERPHNHQSSSVSGLLPVVNRNLFHGSAIYKFSGLLLSLHAPSLY